MIISSLWFHANIHPQCTILCWSSWEQMVQLATNRLAIEAYYEATLHVYLHNQGTQLMGESRRLEMVCTKSQICQLGLVNEKKKSTFRVESKAPLKAQVHAFIRCVCLGVGTHVRIKQYSFTSQIITIPTASRLASRLFRLNWYQLMSMVQKRPRVASFLNDLKYKK